MAVISSLRNKFGNALDKLGTQIHAPELNLSEDIAGGRTTNTGAKNLFTTDVKPSQYYNIPQYKSDNQNQDRPFVGPDPGDGSGIDPIEDLLAQFQQEQDAAASGSRQALPNLQTLANGRTYNLDTLDGRQNYFRDSNASNVADANATYDRTISNINRSKDNLAFNAQKYLDELKAKRAALAQERDNYLSDVQAQGRDFITGKSLGDTKRQNYFTSHGANAFQSSQATSQDYADQQFAQGLGEQQKKKEQALNKFDAQSNAFDTDQLTYNRQLSQDQQDLNQSASDAAFTRDNYVNRAKTELVNSFAPADAVQGVKDFSSRYSLTPYSNVNAEKADLSGAQGFTNFSSPTGPTPAANSTYSLGSGLSPEDNYFGYTPNEKDKKNIQNYFAGAY